MKVGDTHILGPCKNGVYSSVRVVSRHFHFSEYFMFNLGQVKSGSRCGGSSSTKFYQEHLLYTLVPCIIWKSIQKYFKNHTMQV